MDYFNSVFHYRYVGSAPNDLDYSFDDGNPHYSLWKPSGNYYPRGEAPPPYEEAVRSTQMISNLPEHPLMCRNVPQITNAAQCRHQVLINHQSRTNSSGNQEGLLRHTEPIVNVINRKYTKAQLQTTKLSENVQPSNKNNAINPNSFVSCRPVDSHKLEVLSEHVRSNCRKHGKHSKSETVNPVRDNTAHTTTRTTEALYENVPCSNRAKCRSSSNEREPKLMSEAVIESNRSSNSTKNTKHVMQNEYKDLLSHRTLPKNLKELTECIESIADRSYHVETNNNRIHRSLPNHFTKSESILLSVGSYATPTSMQKSEAPITKLRPTKKDETTDRVPYYSLSTSQDEEDYRYV